MKYLAMPLIERSASPGVQCSSKCLTLFATHQIDLVRSLGLGGTSSMASSPATADV